MTTWTCWARPMRHGLITAMVSLCVIPCSAQFSGSVSGIVQDASGGVIPNAKILLENANTGIKQTTTTNTVGLYRFASLPPAEYTVRGEASGFQPQTVTFTLTTGQSAGINLTLPVSSSTERVN